MKRFPYQALNQKRKPLMSGVAGMSPRRFILLTLYAAKKVL